jgi:hypothetical protein
MTARAQPAIRKVAEGPAHPADREFGLMRKVVTKHCALGANERY